MLSRLSGLHGVACASDVPGNTTTTGYCLAVARAVAALTAEVRCLSLTGILDQHLLGGGPLSCPLLGSASIGPSPLHWQAPRLLPTIKSLKRLRLYDIGLFDLSSRRVDG